MRISETFLVFILLLFVSIALFFSVKSINQTIDKIRAKETVISGKIQFKECIPAHYEEKFNGKFFAQYLVPEKYTYTVIGRDSNGNTQSFTFETTKIGYQNIVIGSNWTRPAN